MSAGRRAFLSSTFEDLKDHRARAIQILRAHGFSVDPMEEWTSDPAEPMEFSQDRLDGCEVCVLLVAFRRGHVPSGQQRSITQMEYEAAVQRGIDVLVFILDDDAPWSRKWDELSDDSELQSWRAQLCELHGVGFFSTKPKTLPLGAALSRWLASRSEVTQDAIVVDMVGGPEYQSRHHGNVQWVRFTLLNRSEFHCRVELGLEVLAVVESERTRLRKAGAVLQEYELLVQLAGEGPYPLMADESKQVVLKPGESDAFRLEMRGSEGRIYTCCLTAVARNLENGAEEKARGIEFSVEYPQIL